MNGIPLSLITYSQLFKIVCNCFFNLNELKNEQFWKVEMKKADKILKSVNDNALLIKAFKPSIKISVNKI